MSEKSEIACMKAGDAYAKDRALFTLGAPLFGCMILIGLPPRYWLDGSPNLDALAQDGYDCILYVPAGAGMESCGAKFQPAQGNECELTIMPYKAEHGLL